MRAGGVATGRRKQGGEGRRLTMTRIANEFLPVAPVMATLAHLFLINRFKTRK